MNCRTAVWGRDWERKQATELKEEMIMKAMKRLGDEHLAKHKIAIENKYKGTQ
jgi:hypothetical protein